MNQQVTISEETIDSIAESLARALISRARCILKNGGDVADYQAKDRITQFEPQKKGEK